MYNHVYPIGDIKNHVFTEGCKCQPYLAIYEGEKTLIHNPFDLRDFWNDMLDEIDQIFVQYTGKKPAWGKGSTC